ncbi:hypothetical protein [Kitasatospora sp. NPDC017646]|uniref:hypothetical protein n=1 Tax=Kitasatospora sp. NPDC017646 TaxID=3364024 RepID=UPI0037B16845
MAKNNKKNNRPGRTPVGPAGRRPSPSRSAARRPGRSDTITVFSSVVQLLRLLWDISQKIQ